MRPRWLTIALAALITHHSSLTTVKAADWPGWRGPKGDGSTAETAFPLKWSAAENVKWKSPLPGTGHSSPIVSNGKVFVTACIEAEHKRVLLCLDRTDGRVLWQRVVLVAPLEKKHKLNSYASSTPAADGGRVYVTFLDQPRMRVYCYDFAGNKLWEKSPGEFHSVHGFCSSPVLYKDLVIVNGDQDAEAFLVALDKKTGEERWRIDRPNKLRSYCPPVIGEVNGKPQMVLTGSKCVASYDPDTGAPNWIIHGPTEQFVSSVVFHRGLVLLTAGFPERWVMAIDPTGTGDVTKSHVRWSKKNDGGYVPSPVAHDGYFYLVTDEGMASCWDAKTGRRTWRERLGRHHSGSGVVAGGHVYFTDDGGETFVLKASPEFELVSRNPIGERCYSSPAFSDGEIFLRGDKHLFCISRP
ncbi:MAG TPA: PQQ-binding-like beta-propeller repeat protein [Fimbriiglobus sp.]|nr:PQQ-binding-like beta-propeller repeat protein [Fimbriiglobus sp.]